MFKNITVKFVCGLEVHNCLCPTSRNMLASDSVDFQTEGV